jgi:hypothetical protein
MFRFAPDVNASQHPNGVVLIHLGRGTVFPANRVGAIGAIIQNGVAERRSLEKAAEPIGSESHIPPQTVRQDAAVFLAQLQAEGLLVPHAS